MRLPALFLSTPIALGCIYLAALLKHAKANNLEILSRENLLGSLPLFFAVVRVAALVIIGLTVKPDTLDGARKEQDR